MSPRGEAALDVVGLRESTSDGETTREVSRDELVEEAERAPA